MEFKLMTINIHSGSDAKGIEKLTEKRRTAFLKAIKEEDPDVIALQEVKAQKDIKEINKQYKDSQEDKDEYDSHKKMGEAVVMSKISLFKSNSIGLTDADLKSSKKDASSYAELRARSDIVKITRKDDEQDFFVISWHGKYSGTKIVDRKAQLDALLAIISAKCGTTPFIIAGDFNLEYKYAEQVLKDHKKLKLTTSDDNKIDYFISRDIKISTPSVYKYEDEEKKYLDHNPLSVKVNKK